MFALIPEIAVAGSACFMLAVYSLRQAQTGAHPAQPKRYLSLFVGYLVVLGIIALVLAVAPVLGFGVGAAIAVVWLLTGAVTGLVLTDQNATLITYVHTIGWMSFVVWGGAALLFYWPW